ncbi:MAG TPA: NAD(P)H-dependent glycerol-3-phosphate dehydrogenase [Haliangium sp.]|nr:NAD(P)H-dependent glycerol-3-phosphate dehydrogenase [Haliangium sp.]
MTRIAVVGAGSYGTSLAQVFGGAGHAVSLWCFEPDLAERMRDTRENDVYLPGFRLPDEVQVTNDLAEAVRGCELCLAVTPTQVMRRVMSKAVPHLPAEAVVINCSKGLEEGTLARIDQIFQEILPEHGFRRAAYLSGPTFARELAAGLPAALVVASTDAASAAYVQQALSAERVRLYTSEDVIGVLIGGALKNVVAIAAGVSDGLGFGSNARAALITRGLAEITRIGVHLGADPLTFAGLSGMGDLVLTCSGDLSRNRQVGLALGAGKKLQDIISEMRMVAEGVKTAQVGYQLAQRVGVRAPIMEFMHQVLYQDLPARNALTQLMGRSLRSERE